jgi:multidrug resistance efflux pump
MEKKKQIKKFNYPSSFGSFRCIIRDIQIHTLAHEETDDAQIEKKYESYYSRVSGYVDKVYIKDNDFVKKEILFYN